MMNLKTLLNQTLINNTPFNVLDALKNIKCGKSCGVDGISAEHFVFAHSRIHVLLSLLFSAFITHGYLPDMFMKPLLSLLLRTKLEILVIKTIIDQLLW